MTVTLALTTPLRKHYGQHITTVHYGQCWKTVKEHVIINAQADSGSPVGKSSSAIIKSVETQVSLTLQQEGHVSIQEDTIHVEAVSLDPNDASNGLSFVSIQKQSTDGKESPQDSKLDNTKIKIFTNTSEIPQDDVLASIQLPGNIIDLLPYGNNWRLY